MCDLSVYKICNAFKNTRYGIYLMTKHFVDVRNDCHFSLCRVCKLDKNQPSAPFALCCNAAKPLTLATTIEHVNTGTKQLFLY